MAAGENVNAMRTFLLRLAASNAEFGARKSTAILMLILLAAGICSALHAYEKPFWYDEICTVIMCRLTNGAAIWSALDHAADTNPPFFYFTARLARLIIADDHLGYRLPSILGLLATLTALYWFLSRRVGRLAALVGAVVIVRKELN